MNFNPKILRALLLCAVSITGSTHAQQPGKLSAWGRVWKALQSPPAVSAAAAMDGPPVRDGDQILFRFRAPSAAKVYLAGSFNNWARNQGGSVTDERFAMQAAGRGIWFKRLSLPPQVHQYKYVVVDKNGESRWLPDPHVPAVDAGGGTVFDFSTLPPDGARKSSAGRALRPFRPRPGPENGGGAALDPCFEKVWVRPDQANTLVVTVDAPPPGARLALRIETPFGVVVRAASYPCRSGENRLFVPALKREGGFLARVRLSSRSGRALGSGEAILSVVKNVADDLRYGFYASYGRVGGDYAARAALLARFHINAVEFYDYFPAHGYYAPREADYRFEPFGVIINARDIQRKIEAGHGRNILSLAYIAAYASSQSVYRKYPYPMTDEQGSPLVYTGSVISEAEADRQGKNKLFWLMNVADDSPWHDYILGELGRALDDRPGDLVSFDGFEIDTYGHSADTKFYAAGSRRNGDLLSDVLHDFVGDVQSRTHAIKPHGLVSFNSVNEFGVEKIVDVTDFLFLEIWDFYMPELEEIVDVCARHRAARGQRVILKMYPATMQPAQKSWPEATLRRLLGATMTGAGSLMVVGEPDAESGKMHALNTLYYPDHQPLSAAGEQLLRDYYRYDALMYGWTHGRDVVNTRLDNAIPGCITRTVAARAKKALVVQALHIEGATKWTVDTPASPPRRNLEIALDLPGGVAPAAVWFASPDVPALQTPVRLDFEVAGGRLRTVLPELRVHGTIILRYG